MQAEREPGAAKDEREARYRPHTLISFQTGPARGSGSACFQQRADMELFKRQPVTEGEPLHRRAYRPGMTAEDGDWHGAPLKEGELRWQQGNGKQAPAGQPGARVRAAAAPAAGPAVGQPDARRRRRARARQARRDRAAGRARRQHPRRARRRHPRRARRQRHARAARRGARPAARRRRSWRREPPMRSACCATIMPL